jgi:hypothetical protein
LSNLDFWNQITHLVKTHNNLFATPPEKPAVEIPVPIYPPTTIPISGQIRFCQYCELKTTLTEYSPFTAEED